VRGLEWECQTALATARRTGITAAGFCIATEDPPGEGSRKVPAGGGEREDGNSCNRETGRRPRGGRNEDGMRTN